MNIPLDLQIIICIFLRPIDILALRKVCHQSMLDLLVAHVAGEYIKTCKAFEFTTRQRVVWLAALHRVCVDNTLFLPSFPTSDMSDLELEKAAMGPRRWIDLCGTFKKQNPSDPDAILRLRTTRTLRDASMLLMPYIFLVPGGRYLVIAGNKGLFVWDLGYVSNPCCVLIASIGLEGGSQYELACMVRATQDEMGLIILVYHFKR